MAAEQAVTALLLHKHSQLTCPHYKKMTACKAVGPTCEKCYACASPAAYARQMKNDAALRQQLPQFADVKK
jgi:hypothetical protein